MQSERILICSNCVGVDDLRANLPPEDERIRSNQSTRRWIDVIVRLAMGWHLACVLLFPSIARGRTLEEH